MSNTCDCGELLISVIEKPEGMVWKCDKCGMEYDTKFQDTLEE